MANGDWTADTRWGDFNREPKARFLLRCNSSRKGWTTLAGEEANNLLGRQPCSL